MRGYETVVDMITIVMSSAIAADPQRVWRALTIPDECIAWDEHLLSAVDPMSDYPSPGETIRWRYQMGSVPILMKDHPIDVVPGRKLHSKVTLGPVRFEQTFTLSLEHDSMGENEASKTLLGMKVIASNSAAVMGAVVDRFEIRRITIDRVDATLRAVTKWCEAAE